MDKKKLDDFVKKVEDNTNDALEDTLLDREANLEDTRGFTYDDIVKISTKEKISKLPWLISIFLILTISLAFGYMFFKGNPQTIFINTVDKFFGFLSDNFGDETYDISKGKLNLDLDISTPDVNIGSINASADYTIDNANGLSKLKVTSKDNEDLDLTIYNDSKNTFIYPKGIYDGYIKYSGIKNSNNIKLKNIKSILSGVNQAFDKVAADEKIDGNKVNYDLGDKTEKVYQSSLIINNKNYDRVSDTFINSLKSNDEFVSALAVVMNSNSDTVKSRLDNFLPKLKNYLKDSDGLEIKLYTNRKTNDFLKGEIIFRNGSVNFIKNDEDSFSIGVSSEVLNGNISIDISGNKYSVKINVDGLIKMDGKIVLENNKAKNFGKINMEKVVDEKDLTEEEKNVIYSKIFKNSFLENMFGSTNVS
ncbi:MAG: hypothetical protein IKJ43_04945 [Bacilli bacterium]|nr:hypothetical protein [Bacilli bacterium]